MGAANAEVDVNAGSEAEVAPTPSGSGPAHATPAGMPLPRIYAEIKGNGEQDREWNGVE